MGQLISENRKARHDYHLSGDTEVGICLTGDEVKSMRNGQSSISESYVAVEDGELWLINAYVAPYGKSAFSTHEDRRRRKLLAKKREIARFWNETMRKGMTIIPVRMYFNEHGRVKLLISLAKGKNKSDKRQSDAKRDWGREKQRIMKHENR